MKRLNPFTGIVFLCLMVNLAFGNPSDDLLGIQRTLTYYYDGAALHSIEALVKAYHPRARMTYVDVDNGTYEKFEVGRYLSMLSETEPVYRNRSIKILSLDITGDAAMVKTRITFHDRGMRLNDYLSLHKMEGEWRIVSRTSLKEYATFEKEKLVLWDKTLARDQKEINQVLDTYLQGGDQGNSSVMKAVFHPQAEVTYIDPRKGTCHMVSLVDYLDMYDHSPNIYKKRSHEVLSVDITGNMAVAKVQITYKKSHGKVTDYISLIKTDGGWSIMHKATNKEKRALLAPV